MAVSAAQAGIVVLETIGASATATITVGQETFDQTVNIDLDDILINAENGYWSSDTSGQLNFQFYYEPPGGAIPDLVSGTTISGSSDFNTSTFNSGFFPDPLDTINLGFQLLNQGAGNNETYYGYLSVLPSNDGGYQVKLLSVTYNDTDGAGITYTAVPEPASFALFLGAAFLMAVGLKRLGLRWSWRN